MNSMQVKDKLKNVKDEKHIDFNMILKYYVFDRFIVRLSESGYRDNFILKGGFLLSTLFGLENRSTMDIDCALANISLTKDNVLKMIEAIISIDTHDDIKFVIKDISPIRTEDKYGGYRITLIFEFENIRELLKIDIATGDPITPEAIIYEYKPMLSGTTIKLWTYNLETIIAEKLETILSKLELSSRMKDYYDLYLIYTKDWDNINVERLRQAVQNTFTKRGFNKSLIESFKIIKNSSALKKRWEAYSKKYDYASEIKFETILQCIENIINVIERVSV